MLNWILAILVYKDVLDEEEAKKLAKDLPLKVQSTDFNDSYVLITKLFHEYENDL